MFVITYYGMQSNNNHNNNNNNNNNDNNNNNNNNHNNNNNNFIFRRLHFSFTNKHIQVKFLLKRPLLTNMILTITHKQNV